MKVNLEIVKRGLSTVADYAKAGCAIVIPVVAMTLVDKGTGRIVDKIRYGGKVGYDDAVRAILDSDMFSDAKRKAVSLLKNDGDSEYYRAVMYIVQSSMFSDAKVETIKNLGVTGKIEEESQA